MNQDGSQTQEHRLKIERLLNQLEQVVSASNHSGALWEVGFRDDDDEDGDDENGEAASQPSNRGEIPSRGRGEGSTSPRKQGSESKSEQVLSPVRAFSSPHALCLSCCTQLHTPLHFHAQLRHKAQQKRCHWKQSRILNVSFFIQYHCMQVDSDEGKRKICVAVNSLFMHAKACEQACHFKKMVGMRADTDPLSCRKHALSALQVRLFPRRKLGDGSSTQTEKGRPPLRVDMESIKPLFNLPQKDAAKALGISLTALKQVCRKLGVDRWPYWRRKKGSKATGGDGRAEDSSRQAAEGGLGGAGASGTLAPRLGSGHLTPGVGEAAGGKSSPQTDAPGALESAAAAVLMAVSAGAARAAASTSRSHIP
jgi:hypothetical protein